MHKVPSVRPSILQGRACVRYSPAEFVCLTGRAGAGQQLQAGQGRAGQGRVGRGGQGRAGRQGQARPGKKTWEILGYGFQDMVFRTWDLNFGAWEILGYGFHDMVFRTWDLNFGAWIFTLAISKIET